jgi:hypothetical protein
VLDIALIGIDVEQVKRSDTFAGFVPIAKRSMVEQVHGGSPPSRPNWPISPPPAPCCSGLPVPLTARRPRTRPGEHRPLADPRGIRHHRNGLRAKDICHTLDIGTTANHTESLCAPNSNASSPAAC